MSYSLKVNRICFVFIVPSYNHRLSLKQRTTNGILIETTYHRRYSHWNNVPQTVFSLKQRTTNGLLIKTTYHKRYSHWNNVPQTVFSLKQRTTNGILIETTYHKR